MKINYRMTAMFLIAVALLMVAVSYAFSQRTEKGINYSTRPSADNSEVVRMHLALALLNGKWNDAQKDVLNRAIDDPGSVTEAEAYVRFTPDQVRDIFYKIGTRNIDAYREVFGLDVLADKKRYLHRLDDPTRASVWRTHFARAFALEQLNYEQKLFLIRVSRQLSDGSRTSLSALGEESTRIFSPELGRRLFANLGPYQTNGTYCTSAEPLTTYKIRPLRVSIDCICNVNGTNWSCNDTCQSSTSCVEVDGCGFLWMFKCNGKCSVD